MLVSSRREHHIIALHRLEPRNRIRRDCGVGMADVGSRVDVVNGSGQVIFHDLVFHQAAFASASTNFNGTFFSEASRRQSSYSGVAEPSPDTFTRTVPY